MKTPARIGPYQVVRELGRGGMGVVYEVRDPATPRTLALKLLLQRDATADEQDRFWREVAVLARVRHRGVVRLFDQGRAEQGPYLIQELIEGEDLAAVGARGLEPAEAARICADLAEALGAVHAAGVLHRDVKPANVILQPDGIPVLLDFGLAREDSAERLTQTGALLGTPSYMPPEQAGGEGVDERADVYGVGALLYYLLCGRAPFSGGKLQVVTRILREDPPWPSARGAAVPPGLEAICRVAMAKDPAARYASMAELRGDLLAFRAGDAPQALERLGEGRPAARRARWLGVGALLLLIGAGAAWATGAPAAAAATPSPGPSLASSRAPAAPARFWRVDPARPLRLRLTYVRVRLVGEGGGVDDEGIRIEIQSQLVLQRVAGELQLSFARIAAGSGSDQGHYDTGLEDQPHNGLEVLERAIGVPLRFRADPETGRVGMDYAEVDALRERVMDDFSEENAENLNKMSQMGIPRVEEMFARLFAKDFLERSFNALCWVEGPGEERLGWEDKGGRYRLTRQKLLEPQIPLLHPRHDRNRATTFWVEGTSSWSAGLPRRAELAQSTVGKASKVENTLVLELLD